jgi:hypothetical protein
VSMKKGRGGGGGKVCCELVKSSFVCGLVVGGVKLSSPPSSSSPAPICEVETRLASLPPDWCCVCVYVWCLGMWRMLCTHEISPCCVVDRGGLVVGWVCVFGCAWM